MERVRYWSSPTFGTLSGLRIKYTWGKVALLSVFYYDKTRVVAVSRNNIELNKTIGDQLYLRRHETRSIEARYVRSSSYIVYTYNLIKDF